MLPVRADHAALLAAATPAIDVRSPGEFARGAVPGAVNLPVLTDAERAAVGTCYKRRGRDAAIALGHDLVRDETKAARVAAWREFAAARPDAVIYCARGGLRSTIAQRWLAAAGETRARVAGGFKALRAACLAALAETRQRPVVVVGGRTGTGKTAVVRAAPGGVDLEALAGHRGSAFGGLAAPQPTPIAFENALAVAALTAPRTPPLVLEDEGRTIGRLVVPTPVFEAMRQAPIVLLETPDAERVENILREYVLDADNPAARLPAALARIARRLGGVRHREIAGLMNAAFAAGPSIRHTEAHRDWIRRLLAHYYDPMYDHQLAAKTARIVYRGNAAAVAARLAVFARQPLAPPRADAGRNLPSGCGG